VVFPTIMATIRMTKALSLALSLHPIHRTCLTLQTAKREHDKNIQGKARIYHGIIIVDAALLHTASENDEDGPFSSLKSLLLALWTSIYLQLEPKI
jgi:hypothetical protein